VSKWKKSYLLVLLLGLNVFIR